MIREAFAARGHFVRGAVVVEWPADQQQDWLPFGDQGSYGGEAGIVGLIVYGGQRARRTGAAGTAHEMTARCERFANQLRGRYRLPVEDVDERYSSVEADAGLRERGLSWQERKARVDAEAALIILQSWSDSHANAPA